MKLGEDKLSDIEDNEDSVSLTASDFEILNSDNFYERISEGLHNF